MRYPWPGNVRELRSAVTYAVMQSSRGTVRLSDLPPEISQTSAMPVSASPGVSFAQNDPKQTIQQALDASNGNRSQAAKLLGISRATLYRRMQKMGWTDS